ncbi:hypothetical protein BGW42_005684 [Actinomortierella wolfii]|nr:hypothetical protein BGW42_005684 [Actinomortierella wolfii]
MNRYFSSASNSGSQPTPAEGIVRNEDGVLVSADTGLPWLGRTEATEMPESLPRVQKTPQERKAAIEALDQYLLELETDLEEYSPLNLIFAGIYPQKLAPSLELLEMIEDVIDRLDRNVMTYLRTFTPVLEVYGSYLSGLYSRGSDLDLTLTGNTGNLRPRDVEGMLRYYRYKSVRPLEHMKEFVVQFVDPVTNLHCDLCLNQHLAIQNSLLIGTYVKLDPRVRRMVYGIKKMAKHYWIGGARTNHISNYAYTLWIISFLQMQNPPVLPKLQPSPLPPTSSTDASSSSPLAEAPIGDHGLANVNGHTIPRVFIEGYDCTFDGDWKRYVQTPPNASTSTAQSPNRAISNTASAGELLLSFLEHFGYEHDYIQHDIHTRTASIEPRSLGPSKRLGKLPSPRLRIFDPFVLDRDLGAGARIKGAMRIRTAFQTAANAILEGDLQDVFGDDEEEETAGVSR